jgi:glyoxylase-like metal-dependent hydrolase (beta-lactamase superfamily II)
VLGNRSFVRRNVPILAHRETDRFMAYNCPTCIRNARRSVGARRMGAAGLARPTRLIDHTQSLRVGGREFELVHYGTTFQTNRVPDVRNADLENWQNALNAIAGSSASMLVPAHGPVVEPPRSLESARYLADLRAAVEQADERGVPMQEAAREAALTGYSHWALYAAQHARNVHFTYLKVEAEDLAR